MRVNLMSPQNPAEQPLTCIVQDQTEVPPSPDNLGRGGDQLLLQGEVQTGEHISSLNLRKHIWIYNFRFIFDLYGCN